MKSGCNKGMSFLCLTIILSVVKSVPGGTFSDGTIFTIDRCVQVGTVPYHSTKKIYANLCTIELADDVADISLSNQLFYNQKSYSDWYHYYGCRIGYSGYKTKLQTLVITNKGPDSTGQAYGYTNIVGRALEECPLLRTVDLPSDILEMPVGLFKGCKSLVSCTGGFTNVAACAFEDCLVLDACNLGFLSGVEAIDAGAFHNCIGVTEFLLGEQLTSIGVNAFLGATNIACVSALGLPPSGLPESLLMQNYPTVTYPAEYESEWQEALAECSTNLVVTIDKGMNLIYSAGSSKTIIMSCDVDQVNIYYTLDGTDPTTNSTKYTTKFNVKPQGKMTIKASAIIDRWPYHSVQSITLAPGKCETPTASMADEEVFYFSNQSVTLATTTEESVIRYTLDGSDPTESSMVYAGPIVISETTTIKAKAFRDDYFESETMTVRLVRGWRQVSVPNIVAYYGPIREGNERVVFEGSHVNVVITSVTENAEIHYTVDGTLPTDESSVYGGPFKVFESTTIKAIALKDDWQDSIVTEAVLSKQNNIGDVLKDADTTFENNASYPWVEDSAVFYSGASSMRSGVTPDYAQSVLSATVKGAGHVLFKWKADCESDVYDHEFDHGEFRVDGVESIARIDGQTGWRSEDVRITGEDTHTLSWIYQKDDGDEAKYSGGNIWVDNFVWIPDDRSRVTYRSKNEVPYNWLYEYGLLKEFVPEIAIQEKTGKRDVHGLELTTEADYIAGTDPTNLLSVFRVKIDMSTGSPNISWNPDLNDDGAKSIREYKVWGRETLDAESSWEYPTNALHRFFKVTVEMP